VPRSRVIVWKRFFQGSERFHLDNCDISQTNPIQSLEFLRFHDERILMIPQCHSFSRKKEERKKERKKKKEEERKKKKDIKVGIVKDKWIHNSNDNK
jgi:hypothetical protein